MTLQWRAPDFDPAEVFYGDEPPAETSAARGDRSAAYGARLAAILPLSELPEIARGPEAAPCDPGTGAGQCPRERIKTHRRAAPAGLRWEGGDPALTAELARTVSPTIAPRWDRARAGERILYVGRLAPVPLRTDPSPELVAALAEIPDRRSKVRR